MIAFEMKSWGQPVTLWRLSPYGGSWTEARRETGDPLGTYTLVWHEIEDFAPLYAEVEQVLRRLPATAPDSQQCDNFMTDMPYGTIRLTRGSTTTEIAWNAGCMDDDYVAFLDILKQADTIVGEVGREAPVMREERHPQD